MDTTSSAIEYRRTLEEPPGYGRTRQSRRFGTVRPRGQIPGPRPVSCRPERSVNQET